MDNTTPLLVSLLLSTLAAACGADVGHEELQEPDGGVADARVAESIGIQAIIVGEGLTGGGDDGEVALALDTEFTDDRYLSSLPSGTAIDIETVESSKGNTSENKSHTVECPGDKVAIGGGVALPLSGGANFVAATSNHPLIAAVHGVNGWRGGAIEVNGGTNQRWGIRVYAICANLSN